MSSRVLKITQQGLPQAWISVEEAASDIVAGRVLYAFGAPVAELRGGHNKHGVRSVLEVPAIITTRAIGKRYGVTRPPLSRQGLIARDGYLCMYCGIDLHYRALTIDHIIPRSRGGKHTWTNTCSACVSCNQRKSNKTPEEAGMLLLGVPYEPNLHEHLYLQNRKILADQQQFLQLGFKNLKVV